MILIFLTNQIYHALLHLSLIEELVNLVNYFNIGRVACFRPYKFSENIQTSYQANISILHSFEQI